MINNCIGMIIVGMIINVFRDDDYSVVILLLSDWDDFGMITVILVIFVGWLLMRYSDD